MNSDSSHQKPLEGDNECENSRKSKARVEEWFSTHENKENVTEDNKSTKSSHSSKTHRSPSSHSSTSHYSRTSSLLSAKIKEQQRKAELLARSASLKQKQELEMKKIQLQQQEEELSLKTEMSISDAKCQVLEQFDQCSDREQNLPKATTQQNLRDETTQSSLCDGAKPLTTHTGATQPTPCYTSTQPTVHNGAMPMIPRNETIHRIPLNKTVQPVLYDGTTDLFPRDGITYLPMQNGTTQLTTHNETNQHILHNGTSPQTLHAETSHKSQRDATAHHAMHNVSNYRTTFDETVHPTARDETGQVRQPAYEHTSLLSSRDRTNEHYCGGDKYLVKNTNPLINDTYPLVKINENVVKGCNPCAKEFKPAVRGSESFHNTQNIQPLVSESVHVPVCHGVSQMSVMNSDIHVNNSDVTQCKIPFSNVENQNTGLSNSVNEIASIVQHLRRPPSQISKFGGNVLNYKRFLREFKSVIVSNCSDYDELLHYLEQFTIGEPNRIVTSCSYLESKQGYEAAMKELNDRYGDHQVIANAFIKKALNWPNIKGDNPKSLDEFAIFLTECENAVRSIDAVKVLEYSENLKQLVRKLPYYMHDKWRNLVQSSKDRGEVVNFHHLVCLVKQEAKKVNDLDYGREALSHEQHKHITVKKHNTSTVYKHRQNSFATSCKYSNQRVSTSDAVRNTNSNVSQNTAACLEVKPCFFCKERQHSFDSCDTFKALQSQQKFEFVKSKGLCFGCLKPGHQSKLCRSRLTCHKCHYKHPTILHYDKPVIEPAKLNTPHVDDTKSNTEVKVPVTSSVCANQIENGSDTGAGEGECTMAIIPVRVKLKNSVKSVVTYAFLDPGSSVTFCTDSLVDRIGATGRKACITLNTMGEPYTMNTNMVSGIELCDLSSDNLIQLPRVYTKDTMPVSKLHIPTQDDISQWQHLYDVSLPAIDAEVELLIGNNVPDAYTPLEIRAGPRGSPHATKTLLGWVAWNVIRDQNDMPSMYPVNRADIISVQTIENLNQLDYLVRQSINSDFPENIINDKREYSQEDKLFLTKVNDSIHLVDGHYHISLPFKNNDVKLPNNYDQAVSRLNSLKSKLSKSPQLHSDYTEFMNAIIDKGYAEIVPDDELVKDNGKVWYIPHHAVYHPRKPNKVRVVFDCAATYQGMSLNKSLLQGPDMTNTLLGVLLRFRQDHIAIMADIESMFYQVKVPKADCDFLRFVWWPNGNLDKNPVCFRMLVHLFGAVSSPSCANMALRQTVKDNLQPFDQSVTDTILHNFYVDDCLKSVVDEQTGISLISDISALCQQGGFHLTKWTSNSRDVLSNIPLEERSKEIKELNFDVDNIPPERALGVYWTIESDSLSFRIQIRPHSTTRRGILSVVSSVYDPLGLAAPFVLPAKILLQELCEQKLGWDDVISSAYIEKWHLWLKQLTNLEKLSVPRCLKPLSSHKTISCEIHNFADASNVGYGMVSYLRFVDEQECIHVSLLTGKSRVAPLKKITTPRMELTAATLAVRICNMTVNELEIAMNDTYYWTDSMSVLMYIRNEKTRFHTFVSNRLSVIHSGSEVEQWNYIDTASNPEDDVSRGLVINDHTKVERWINGPNFLHLSKKQWPDRVISDKIPESDPEVKGSVNANVVCTSEKTDFMTTLFSHYSNWHKLKRIVGLLLVAKENLKHWSLKRKELILENKMTEHNSAKMQQIEAIITQSKHDSLDKFRLDKTQMYLSLETLQNAETVIVKHVQSQYFANEIKTLENIQNDSSRISKNSAIYRLDPILVNGVLRVGGRLSLSNLPYDAKHPIILPKQSLISKLIMFDAHKNVGHLGKNSMLSNLRQKYWIPNANSAAKQIISKCVMCRKYQAKVGEQKMSDLPKDRITPDEPPFTRVGVDYFGPIEVKRGRSIVKRYGVIFTCLASRAVHLEVAYSLDTDSCINALRRFIARRGSVKVMRSDNGTNLIGCDRELREETMKWNESKIQKEMQQSCIQWHFNPPSGSHFGGVWERLIRSVRKILYSLLQERLVRLDDEMLHTLFCEVELILNNRPITTISDNHSDLEALTPNHLLLLRPGDNLPCGLFDENENYSRRRWRQIQYLSHVFWKRWVKEYLPLLQVRQKWLHPKRNLQVNDIVMIVDTNIRSSYTLGRILSVKTDKKGLVRIATVKTKTTVLQRPVDKLCVLLEADTTV